MTQDFETSMRIGFVGGYILARLENVVNSDDNENLKVDNEKK